MSKPKFPSGGIINNQPVEHIIPRLELIAETKAFVSAIAEALNKTNHQNNKAMSEQLFQVGDVVSCPRFCSNGESGIVGDVDFQDDYPIEVKFKRGYEWYTADGRYDKELPPTLQHGPMNWTPNHVRPTPPFPAKGAPIWVSDNKERWHLRIASGFAPGDSKPVKTVGDIKKSGAHGHDVMWRYWLPFDAIKIDQE